jgi:DNA-binding NarL/FixJ family response regulator
MMAWMSRTILLVDDHAGFRRSARALLDAEGFDVIGEAADGHEALRLANELAPQVILLDVQLPDLDGFEVAGRLVRDDGPTVILISSRAAREYGGQVEASSAHGFIAKSRLTGAAIREIAS